MRYAIVGAVCVGLLAACGDSKPPQKTVFEPQVQALKKAREVGAKVDAAAQQQREQIERETASEK